MKDINTKSVRIRKLHDEGVPVADYVKSSKMVGTRMFSRMNYQVIRGMKELITVQKLSDMNWKSIKQFFDNRCVYCGVNDTGDTRNGLVPDHLIPASDNGDYVIGNVVPACHDCNDRRGRKPWNSWLKHNFPAEAEIKADKIHQYLKHHPYIPEDDPELKLTVAERKEYEAILSEHNIAQ